MPTSEASTKKRRFLAIIESCGHHVLNVRNLNYHVACVLRSHRSALHANDCHRRNLWHHIIKTFHPQVKPQIAEEPFHFALQTFVLAKTEDQYGETKPAHLDISCIPFVKKHIFRTELVWPSNVLTHVKSDKAHILIVESAEEVATHWSTGEKRTHQMPFLWPRKVPKGEPSDIFHIYEETSISESSF